MSVNFLLLLVAIDEEDDNKMAGVDPGAKEQDDMSEEGVILQNIN